MSGKRVMAAVAAAGMLVAVGCESVKDTMRDNRTAQGAVIGTAGGALAGAVIGEASSGDAGKGALIGAVAGGLLGTGVGYYMEKQRDDLKKIDHATVTETQYTDPQTQQTVPILAVSMSDQVLFDFNSAQLRPEARPTLDQVATVLTDPQYPAPQKILVIGHTDNVGNFNYNVTLSQQRAQSVASYLQTRGVNAALMEAVGMGPNDPVASNDTAEGRAQNRRVELRIIPAQ